MSSDHKTLKTHAPLESARKFDKLGLKALHIATSAATPIERITAGPATPAATPILTNKPVLMMEPKPIIVALKTPSSRLRTFDLLFMKDLPSPNRERQNRCHLSCLAGLNISGVQGPIKNYSSPFTTLRKRKVVETRHIMERQIQEGPSDLMKLRNF